MIWGTSFLEFAPVQHSTVILGDSISFKEKYTPRKLNILNKVVSIPVKKKKTFALIFIKNIKMIFFCY